MLHTQQQVCLTQRPSERVRVRNDLSGDSEERVLEDLRDWMRIREVLAQPDGPLPGQRRVIQHGQALHAQQHCQPPRDHVIQNDGTAKHRADGQVQSGFSDRRAGHSSI